MRNRMSRSATTRPAVATMLLALCVMLAACAGIPQSGPVEPGPVLGEEATAEFVFFPLGPAKDATQQQILEGFVSAFTGTQGDYAVARQFLSESLKKEWNPRHSVLVRSGAAVSRVIGDTTMEYSFTTNAQVDEFGAYTRTPEGRQNLQFQFVQEDGQWRISDAPDGIVLPESIFLRIFSKHALYFYDLSLQRLVPDQRWFPGGTTATRIVTALLAGPPEWLRGAVVSQFPDGTQLAPGTTVVVEATVAQVDLTAEAAGADERQRQLMRLQLGESLGSVSGITSVDVSVAGTPLTTEPLGADSPVVQSRVDARPLVLAEDGFGYIASGEVTPIDGLSEKVVALEPTAATLGVSGNSAAVLAPDGMYIVRTGQEAPVLADTRPGLIAPSLDDYGYAWSVPADDAAAIVAFDFEGNAHPVAANLPAGAVAHAMEVSRDGSRIALLLSTPSGPRLLVSAIIRDPGQDLVPTALGDPVLDTLIDADTAIDATWADELSVATLAAADGQNIVTVHEIGGLATSLGRPEPSIAIVGGNGRNGLRVLGEDHVLRAPRGSSWQSTPVEAVFIATQR